MHVMQLQLLQFHIQKKVRQLMWLQFYQDLKILHLSSDGPKRVPESCDGTNLSTFS